MRRGGAVRALWVGALVGAAHLAGTARASPGDVLARSDFRNQEWVVAAPSGTGSAKGMELDYAQNTIKLKDAGKHSWWFESPEGFFKGDMTLAYNGTVEFQLQSLEWEATFLEGYDIVLVSSAKRHTIGLKGVKRDGDTSKTYSVRLSESAGAWEHLHPTMRKDGGGLRVAVAKEDMIKALSTLKAIRVRGGYYMGVEKTQLRSLRLVQGVQAHGEELMATGDGECCGDRDRTCTSSRKFDVVFDSKGLDCIEYTTVSTGTLVVGDDAGNADKMVRLAMGVSSPDAEFYKDGQMDITGGACGPAGGASGCSGTVTDYLGELSWTINSGVTQVEVEAEGSGCASGGFFAARAANGTGFDALFDVKYKIPSVTLTEQGVGCSAGTTEGPFNEIAETAGVVTAVTLPPGVTGTGYISGRAYVQCDPPCTGAGLEVDCVADGGGDITGLTVSAGGSGYDDTNAPTIYCPEGTVGARTSEGPFTGISTTGGVGPVASLTDAWSGVLGSGYLAGEAIVECHPPCVGNGLRVSCAVDAFGDITALSIITPGDGYDAAKPPSIRCREDENDPPNPGSGFAGTFVTNNQGAILYVAVTNPGSGYNANIKITQTPKQPTCVDFVWNPQPSGYLPTGTSTVKILSPGNGFTHPPSLSIRSGGEGCEGVSVRTTVGDATPDVLVDGATSGGIISLRGTSCDYRDGYYDGMTFVWYKADASKFEVRQIRSFTSVGRTISLETPLTETPAANDIYAITKTPRLTLETFGALLYGQLAGRLECTCTGGTQTKVNDESAATRASCVCEVQLASTVWCRCHVPCVPCVPVSCHPRLHCARLYQCLCLSASQCLRRCVLPCAHAPTYSHAGWRWRTHAHTHTRAGLGQGRLLQPRDNLLSDARRGRTGGGLHRQHQEGQAGSALFWHHRLQSRAARGAGRCSRHQLPRVRPPPCQSLPHQE